MTTLDDITADVNAKITTQTTGDNSALRVRQALINLATQILDDVAAEQTAIDAGIATASAVAPAAARAAAPAFVDILGAAGMHAGQVRAGLQNVGVSPGSGGVANAQMDGSGNPGSPGSVMGWMVSGFIAVIPGSTMTVGVSVAGSVGNMPFNFFTSGKVFISGAYPSVGGQWTNGETFTVPSNAAFMRFSYDAFHIHFIQLLQGTVAAADIPHKWRSQASTVHMHRPWAGRLWMFCGDSMGAARTGNTWVGDVAQYHGIGKIYNEAIDGGTVASLMQKYNRPTDFSRVDLVAGDFTNMDAVITQVGVNDAPATTLGTINDATTASTFYGRYKKFIELVLGSNPRLKLILGTPTGKHYPGSTGSSAFPGTGTADDETVILPYRQAVRDLCDKYALACWDVGKTSQMSAFAALAYSADGLHPSYSNQINIFGTPGIDSNLTHFGSKIVFGSNLAAFMHTVFPADWSGDPLVFEDMGSYNIAAF
jgi:hypothetical protein